MFVCRTSGVTLYLGGSTAYLVADMRIVADTTGMLVELLVQKVRNQIIEYLKTNKYQTTSSDFPIHIEILMQTWVVII